MNMTIDFSLAARMRRMAGITLVELMISMTIGLLLLAGVALLMSTQSSSSTELEKASRQIENGRYAIQLLHDDIQMAGYYGPYSRIPAPPSTLPAPCQTALAPASPALPLIDGLTVPVHGYDSPAAVPAALSCLNSADFLGGTDVLVIRRADSTTLPLDDAEAGTLYIQAGLNTVSQGFEAIIGDGADTSVFTLKKKDGSAADLRRYLVHIYFVSPCSNPAGSHCAATDDGGRPIPTLKRLELGTSGTTPAFVTVPLVEGIENMQLDYGIDTNNDGAPDYYSTGTTKADGTTLFDSAEWSNVMTVRVNLLARNTEPTAGHEDTKTYVLGGAGEFTPTATGYKRHVFSELVRAVNPSARREQ